MWATNLSIGFVKYLYGLHTHMGLCMSSPYGPNVGSTWDPHVGCPCGPHVGWVPYALGLLLFTE